MKKLLFIILLSIITPIKAELYQKPNEYERHFGSLKKKSFYGRVKNDKRTRYLMGAIAVVTAYTLNQNIKILGDFNNRRESFDELFGLYVDYREDTDDYYQTIGLFTALYLYSIIDAYNFVPTYSDNNPLVIKFTLFKARW